jgi:hypothetical protein
MEPKRGRRSGRPAGAADKGVAAGGGDAVAARRKRSSKNPDVELIAALQVPGAGSSAGWGRP